MIIIVIVMRLYRRMDRTERTQNGGGVGRTHAGRAVGQQEGLTIVGGDIISPRDGIDGKIIRPLLTATDRAQNYCGDRSRRIILYVCCLFDIFFF